MRDWLNIVAKWRSVLAGWQLGTRDKGDPECDAVRDINEARILARVELNAIAGLLLRKGVLTQQEFDAALVDEAQHLNGVYEEKFPGFTAHEDGITMKMPEAATTMARLRFKP